MLILDNISCERKGRVVFSELNFCVNKGSFLLVKGKNGCGKSSLLRIIVGLLRFSCGSIKMDNMHWEHMCSNWMSKFFYLGHSLGNKDYLTFRENLMSYASVNGGNFSLISSALEKFGILSLENSKVSDCSSGQRKRLALSRSLLIRKKIWVLDEPLCSLDYEGTKNLRSLIISFCNQGGAVIAAEHNSIELLESMPIENNSIDLG